MSGFGVLDKAHEHGGLIGMGINKLRGHTNEVNESGPKGGSGAGGGGGGSNLAGSGGGPDNDKKDKKKDKKSYYFNEHTY